MIGKCHLCTGELERPVIERLVIPPIEVGTHYDGKSVHVIIMKKLNELIDTIREMRTPKCVVCTNS